MLESNLIYLFVHTKHHLESSMMELNFVYLLFTKLPELSWSNTLYALKPLRLGFAYCTHPLNQSPSGPRGQLKAPNLILLVQKKAKWGLCNKNWVG